MSQKRLQRSQNEKILFGVCGGIAEYFNVDVTWVRLGFIAATFLGGPGIVAYLVGALVIPRKRRALTGATSMTALPSTALRRY